MKRILLAILVMLVFAGCTKKVKEEYIPLFQDGETTYYIATPSGVVVYSTNSETYYTFMREDGSIININDLMEAQNEKN